MRLKQAFALLKQAAASWSEDRAPSMGAAISYYSLFSMAPLLVIIIAVAGLFFGADAVQGALFGQISDLMGEDAARAVDEMLKHAQEPKTGGVATVVSVLVLLFGASTVLAELQGALDVVWRVPVREKESGLWRWLRTRLLTFGMVLAMAFLMVVSLVLSAVVATLGKWWGPMFGAWEAVAHAADLVVSLGLLTVVFAAIYKFMPRAHIRWRDVWIGAGVTSLLFTIGKILIGLYLGKSDIASSFGMFGSVAIMMVWIYYSAQIFLLGAEFTWVYANEYGSRRDEAQEKPKLVQHSAPGVPEVQIHAAFVNTEAANAPLIGYEDGKTGLRRHLPELAVSAAFIAGALLGKAAPAGLRLFLKKRQHVRWAR